MADSAESQQAMKTLEDVGARNIARLQGEEKAKKFLSSVPEFVQPVQDYVTRSAFGSIWSRPGLEWRDRSLVVMSICAAMGQTNQLASHVMGGLNNGLSETEIQEVMLMVTGYCGFPRGLEATKAANEAIKTWKEQNKTT